MTTTTIRPQRFQRRRVKGWRKPEGSVCVTRPGRFGNHAPGALEAMARGDSAGAVALYAAWLALPEQAYIVAAAKRELRGKDLCCYCTPRSPCHADILLVVANSP